jgi:hypothetical protein
MTVAHRDAPPPRADFNGAPMRCEKLESLLRVALDLRGNAEGLSLVDIQRRYGVSRRTAERMRDAIERVFPQLEQANPGELPNAGASARALSVILPDSLSRNLLHSIQPSNFSVVKT